MSSDVSTAARRLGHALANNRMLVAGITLLLIVVLFSVVGSWFVTREMADVGAGRPSRPPNFEHLLVPTSRVETFWLT